MVNQKLMQKLAKMALNMRKMAYVPYSHHRVGAALLCKDGRIYTGCNIENAAYTPSNCAERTAFFKAVSEGEKDFVCIAIAGGLEDREELDYCPPCGVCRQVMREFCSPGEFDIILVKDMEHMKTMKLSELLPESFGPEFLQEKS
ncbi:cytidine deaminase [Lachnospiraceae bacterium YH-ros2228]|nr:cytidine deaminase [Lachnospiraceae bacterium]